MKRKRRNSITSQFFNPPNYKVNASNATIFQDYNLPGPDKFNSSDDAPPNSSNSASLNAFTTLSGYTENITEFPRVSLLCGFYDGNKCNYKCIGSPCDRKHQLVSTNVQEQK